MSRDLASLSNDRRGLAAIEFAFLAPVMILLICATIDLGYVFMAQTSLTSAVAQAARESAATQELSQSARDQAMRQTITSAMSSYLLVPGQQLTISSTVYRNFSETRPEDYTDVNGNGRYDGPAPPFVGEPFTDRNGNGVWDAAIPIAGSTTGEEGEVVSYTATYPVQHLFGFLKAVVWKADGATLTATSVVRNEPVKTE